MAYQREEEEAEDAALRPGVDGEEGPAGQHAQEEQRLVTGDFMFDW